MSQIIRLMSEVWTVTEVKLQPVTSFTLSWMFAMRNSGFSGSIKGSLSVRRTPCYVIITSRIRLKTLHAASFSQSQKKKQSEIKLFQQCGKKGLLKIRQRMSHGMHQTHITTLSAPLLLWCLWEQTVLVLRTWDVYLFSITTWPQLTPSAESKSVTSAELYRSLPLRLLTPTVP